jgi:hypothetical protein
VVQSSPAPYPLNRNQDGIYYFATSGGVIYFCKFVDRTPFLSPLLGIYDVQVLEFEFYPYLPDGVEQQKGMDERIPITITHLLREAFSSPLIVVVYMCDAADGKHHGRHKLFKSWHITYMSTEIDRIPIEFNILSEKGEILDKAYGCTLLRHDFPHMDVLQKELISEAVGIISEKYD